jgi:hypothetical protein
MQELITFFAEYGIAQNNLNKFFVNKQHNWYDNN